ncbi:hypothetical protein INR49_002553 [Caranx melampygus]|nr:hypothetical protein INR49_002553 [Caranx melampygus]
MAHTLTEEEQAAQHPASPAPSHQLLLSVSLRIKVSGRHCEQIDQNASGLPDPLRDGEREMETEMCDQT